MTAAISSDAIEPVCRSDKPCLSASIFRTAGIATMTHDGTVPWMSMSNIAGMLSCGSTAVRSKLEMPVCMDIPLQALTIIRRR